jgi:peptidoglycan/xylan/chitin deacetylase (PgdA/CDA1 family)
MKQRGMVTFVFDDGYQAVYDEVVPLLQQYQTPAVFAVPLQSEVVAQQTQTPTLSADVWMQLVKEGHEVAAHGQSHRDLTTLTEAELESELAEPARYLKASTLVYPGGAHNDRVAAAAKHYYRAARTVVHGFESVSPQNPWRLKTYDFTQANFSVWKANLLVLWAWLTNRWLIETYHVVSRQPSQLSHYVSLSDFSAHLKFVSRLPVAVKTIKQALEV